MGDYVARWFDTTHELHEIKHVVHSDMRIQVNKDVSISQEGCWKLVRLIITKMHLVVNGGRRA